MSFPIVDNVSTMSGRSLWLVVSRGKGVRSFVTVRSLVSKYRAPVAFGLRYRVPSPGGDSQASELVCMNAGVIAMSGHSGSRSEASSGLNEIEGMIVETYCSVELVPSYVSIRTCSLGVHACDCQLAGSVKRLS